MILIINFYVAGKREPTVRRKIISKQNDFGIASNLLRVTKKKIYRSRICIQFQYVLYKYANIATRGLQPVERDFYREINMNPDGVAVANVNPT